MLATHHQGHEKYGDSAGRQCTAMAYFSIIFSVIKRPSHRGVFNLDYILDECAQIYKSAGVATALLEMSCPLILGLQIVTLKVKCCLEKVPHLAVGISYFKETSL